MKRVVAADTSPLNYLVLIGSVEVLPQLYGRVAVPGAVLREITARDAPDAVRKWIRSEPDWIDIVDPPPEFGGMDRATASLDAGELAAIRLAGSRIGSLLLIDEAAGRLVAARLGIRVTGTLGILRDAAEEGLVDLGEAVERLGKTNFRASASLIRKILSDTGRS